MNRERWMGPGIPDEEFIRESGVPMTKNEIRVLSLAKLRLFPGAVIYDVGAGTGSVSIECKLFVPDSRVFAVEQDQRALRLLTLNRDKFGVELNLIAGSAPEALAELPTADRIFIGGSGGRLMEIIEVADQKLAGEGWIVVNAVSMHTGPQAFQRLEDKGYQVEAIQVNIAVSSSQGEAQLWLARNPVTIVAGQKKEQHDEVW